MQSSCAAETTSSPGPIAIATGAISQPGESILYTTLVGEGSDPYTGNGNPWLFYIHAPKWPDWPDAVVVNRQVHVTYQ